MNNCKKMKILLVTGDVWNDSTNGNNIYTNWFKDYDAEFANIYLSPGVPENTICSKYFQVTDKMMARSLLFQRAGQSFEQECKLNENHPVNLNVEREDVTLYTIIKRFAGEPLRIAREILWTMGRYNIPELKKFIDEFKPDIVFCPHLFSLKYRRIERIVHSMTDAPMVGFTGDAEASLRAINYNPLFWLRQLTLHLLYKKHIKLFKWYFTFSKKQCEEITKRYGVPAETLYKCADVVPLQQRKTNEVIKLVYAGRLYCNRWRTISAIGDALVKLNKDSCKAEVYVYSQDKLTAKQQKALSPQKYIHFMGAIHPSLLPKIYKEADIALHVESFGKKDSYITMHSFSTKIVDLLSCSSAIMALCKDNNNGWNYLRKEKAAICISDTKDILPIMQSIVDNPSLLNEYALRAHQCLQKNHSRKDIHRQIERVFTFVIEQ